MKKYLIMGVLAVLLAIGGLTTMSVMAQSGSGSSPVILTIDPNGKMLLRGTVVSVGADSLAIKSWGGTWTVRVTPTTEIISATKTLADFSAGDVAGVRGNVFHDVNLTATAEVLRDWGARSDNDKDGVPDDQDIDDDNDGAADSNDGRPHDHDNDGVNDPQDSDDDNDTVADVDDDDDGDSDDDNDGVVDSDDDDDIDHDNDGIDNKRDLDDDNDGTSDSQDSDDDNDGTSDSQDSDDDNDGTSDLEDDDDNDDDESDSDSSNSGSGSDN